jgi:hypothetical protein
MLVSSCYSVARTDTRCLFQCVAVNRLARRPSVHRTDCPPPAAPAPVSGSGERTRPPGRPASSGPDQGTAAFTHSLWLAVFVGFYLLYSLKAFYYLLPSVPARCAY